MIFKRRNYIFLLICLAFGTAVIISKKRTLKIEKQEVSDDSIQSLSVIAFMRPDFVERILKSIDFPVEYIFLLINRYDNVTEHQIKLVATNFYENDTRKFVKRIVPYTPGVNAGYAGAVNIGIKAMLFHNLQYTVFVNDDTVFLPSALKLIQKTFVEEPGLCLYHFSKYVLWGTTSKAFHELGYMDELLWPAYLEDCDYHFRSQIMGCTNFYGRKFKYIEHGDYKDAASNRKGGTTRRKSTIIAKLISNTQDNKRGGAAYMFKKWGPYHEHLRSTPLAKRRDGKKTNVCTEMHANLDRRDTDEEVRRASVKPKNMYSTPYDSKNMSVRDWLVEWKSPDSLSSRSVNIAYAPAHFQAVSEGA